MMGRGLSGAGCNSLSHWALGTHITGVEVAYQDGSDWSWDVRLFNDAGGKVAIGFRKDRLVLWDSVTQRVIWTIMTQGGRKQSRQKGGGRLQPSDGFWEGVGASVGTSPGWMVIGALLVVGVLFVVAKYVYPGHKEIKMRELDIRQKEAENDAERIKANSALAENMRGLRESNDQLAQQSAAVFAGIEESKARSRGMGEDMSHVRSATDHIVGTTDETNELVKDIKRRIIGAEGTD